jgi:hypothetical protein
MNEGRIWGAWAISEVREVLSSPCSAGRHHRELSEDTSTPRVEEKEATLGRPLNRAEQQQLIDQLGHPALLAAGRYGPRRRLIGPELFPFYWLVLRLALGANLLAQLIATAFALASNSPVNPLLRASAAGALCITLAVVTIVFAAFSTGVPTRFSAAVGIHVGWTWKRWCVRDGVAHPIARLVWGACFVALWIAARRFPQLILGAGAEVFRLGGVEFRCLVLVFAGVSIANAGLDRLAPAPPQRAGVHFAMKVLGGVGGGRSAVPAHVRRLCRAGESPGGVAATHRALR